MKSDISIQTKKLTIAKLSGELLEALNDFGKNNKGVFASLNEEVVTASDLVLEDLTSLLAAVSNVFSA